ncbi:hypothetical protein H5410_051873 [Solanum commersonii]|uniref:Disease resistance N-terminal domain-containing protein n=1 Tax=Solanum commersonii TaxID=4109 RepID=A0A9J5X1Z8_SOLCO|nr:hypothetical protein H5410_051873 [Solanum commersonii]
MYQSNTSLYAMYRDITLCDVSGRCFTRCINRIHHFTRCIGTSSDVPEIETQCIMTLRDVSETGTRDVSRCFGIEGANATMADPVIGATIQVVLEKLLSLTIKELSSSRDWKKDLEMLTKNISLIQAFTHDAERRQVEDQAVEL